MTSLNQGKQTSSELIIYQLGEVKNLLENMTIKFDAYKSSTDARLIALEKSESNQAILNNIEPKIDIQKIILAAFGVISTIAASALAFNQYARLK